MPASLPPVPSVLRSGEAVRAAVRPNTKLIHVETPGNPTTGISDLPAIAAIAHEAGALLSVDATFAGPICMYPLNLGADLEIHSMTKYINGHGDSLGGCVLGKTELIDKIKEIAMVNFGGILSPFNAWIVARGLSTLPLRMAQHSKVALAVAEFLEQSPAVRFVWYPGLKSHPQHDRAVKYMNGQYSGMISFDIKGSEEQHQKFLDALHLVTHRHRDRPSQQMDLHAALQAIRTVHSNGTYGVFTDVLLHLYDEPLAIGALYLQRVMDTWQHGFCLTALKYNIDYRPDDLRYMSDNL